MIINVVIRNIDNTIYKVDCIKYVDDIKDVSFLSDVLAEKYNKQKEMKNYFCDYDIECKKKYLSKLGEKSGKIVLSVDFNTLSFEEYFRITRDDSITINCIP